MGNQLSPQHKDNNTIQQASAFFRGRKLLIATMHKKEEVLAPSFSDALGVLPEVCAGLDTDQFGTFTGEVDRKLSPLDTARLKCLRAHQQTGIGLVLASEGSFGPHPEIGFIPANQELLLLIDFENDLEFKTLVTSTNTNFAGERFTDWRSIQRFAEQVSFPEHRLIIKKSKEDFSAVVKGVGSWALLEQWCTHFLGENESVYVETDMRALYNPTRMKVIALAAKQLIEKINHSCSACSLPGMEVSKVIPGLPCEWCGLPTRSTRSLLYECKRCSHAEEVHFPHGKKVEDPTFCNYCNP